ncbi:unnamed protein product [Larinioides sclopetarius]
MKHSPIHKLFWGVAMTTLLLLSMTHPSSAEDDNASKLTAYFKSISASQDFWFPNDTLRHSINIDEGAFHIDGITMPMCNMFGCDMGDTDQPKCDPGYKWDSSFNRCREMVY